MLKSCIKKPSWEWEEGCYAEEMLYEKSLLRKGRRDGKLKSCMKKALLGSGVGCYAEKLYEKKILVRVRRDVMLKSYM